MTAPYFPIQLNDMLACMNFNNIKSNEKIQLGNVVVESVSLGHPNGALGINLLRISVITNTQRNQSKK